ncbi:Hypothetical predicted protein [Mytilus galloprovincialis]|uniref:Uncharacterized protein n=1 Tax=Mytilus galloprovincialis TaxID=29158 RepID=A0A8B6EYA2_MYTGA|nr:Hypothetical predicted protein [Mytilus galloprovincialis]
MPFDVNTNISIGFNSFTVTMRKFVLLALLYVIHVKEADLFFLDCSKGSDKWRTCYHCQCNHHHYSSKECNHCRLCDIQCDVHTNAPLPVVTGSPITTSKPHSSTCDIVAIFDAVARNQFVENVNATTCLNGKGRHGNDALVMTLCNAPESARWIEGEQVLFRDGTCSESAKPYTPIFYHQNNVRLAGILISCSGSEIRVGYYIVTQNVIFNS